MKNNKRLITGLVLALAGAMLWANLSWAQAQGGACCPAANPAAGSAPQVQGQGAVCPVTPQPNSPHVKGAGPQSQENTGQKAPNPDAVQPKTGK
jgi:hypothetical protein